MTHYYLYIKAGVQLDTDTRFYKVAIGTSAAQVKLYTWLEAYAAEHGHFFVIWDETAREFYTKCRDQIGSGAAPLIGTDAKELRKTLQNGCEDPALWQAVQHRHNLLMQIDSHYYSSYMISKRQK